MSNILEYMSFYEKTKRIQEEFYDTIHKKIEYIISELINYIKKSIENNLEKIKNKETRLVYILAPKKWFIYTEKILEHILGSIDIEYKEKISKEFYKFSSKVAETIWNSLLIEIMTKNGFRKVNYIIDVFQVDERYEKDFGFYLDFSISENDILLYNL